MKPDYRDAVGGVLMGGIGIFVAAYAISNYDLGRISKLGPGAFPAAMGIVLAVLGGIILVSALLRDGPPVSFRLRPILCISAALAAFVFVIGRFGVVPAVAAVVLVAVLAESKPHWREAILLAAGLAAVTVAIFKYGLGMEIPLVDW